jgi:drug/metabolite transporter (DMT)-like permease
VIETAAALMLLSGATNAAVAVTLKSGRDMMASRALIDGWSALLVLPLAAFVPLPHGAWQWLAASFVLHLLYLLAVVKAYEVADMSAVYPIIRGSAPVIAAAAAVLVLGDPLSLPVAAGVGLVSLGAMVVAFWRAPSRRGLAWALFTGFTVAAYTVVDAEGARAAPSAPSYIAWVFLTMGTGVAALFGWRRREIMRAEAAFYWRRALVGGVLSLVTYGAALWALRIGDVPRLAALRESSILFGVLLAAFVLKERVGRARVLSAVVIAMGAAVLITVR